MGLLKGEEMILSFIVVSLMWQTFRFKFKTRGAVLSMLFVIGVSFGESNIIGIATATALFAGFTTIILNYAKMIAKSMTKFTRGLRTNLSNGFSKMKR